MTPLDRSTEADGEGPARPDRRPLVALSRDEERTLAIRWRQTRDPAARNELIMAHMNAVRAIARRYKKAHAQQDDLVGTGLLGLFRACDSFDPDRGIRFATYASHWVRAEILGQLWRSRSVVPAARSKLQRRVHPLRHERRAMFHQTGDLDRVDEVLAARARTTVEGFRTGMREWARADTALDAPASGDTHRTLLDELADPDSNHEKRLIDQQLTTESKSQVNAALAALDPRERLIIEQHVMAESPESLTQIGVRLGVSRERVRQLEVRAKAKLRAKLEESTACLQLMSA